MNKPGPLLAVLLLLGLLGAGFLASRRGKSDAMSGRNEAPANSNDSERIAALAAAEPESMDALKKQILILRGQVEYLQGQVDSLQAENSTLIDKLGLLGMKTLPDMLPEDAAPDTPAKDYVGMGMELVSFRELRAAPIPTLAASRDYVEERILAWLKSQYPGDYSQRQGRALAALGVIPKAVDVLPLRAAMLARRLGGWYDAESQSLLVVEVDDGSGTAVAADAPLALAHGYLLRQFQEQLFPPGNDRLSTDARLAHEALLDGDAVLVKFLYGLKNPQPPSPGDLPLEDPDHPLNEVPMPIFLRELELFPFSRGFDFAQSLHSAGAFRQLGNAYSRLPSGTVEIIEPEIYLANEPVNPVRLEMRDVNVEGKEPFWNDTLGRFASFVALKASAPDEVAGEATRNWRGDRFMAYAADGRERNHAVWQTLWGGESDARKFYQAMREALSQRYGQAPDADPAATHWEFELPALQRHVSLQINRGGRGVLLIDAATGEFARAAGVKFKAQEN